MEGQLPRSFWRRAMTPEGLRQFCSTDPFRPDIQTPWSRGEHTYATNGHIIIRVPIMPNVAEREVAPNAETIFRLTALQTDLRSLRRIEFSEITKEVCPYCDGRGSEHDCPH